LIKESSLTNSGKKKSKVGSFRKRHLKRITKENIKAFGVKHFGKRKKEK